MSKLKSNDFQIKPEIDKQLQGRVVKVQSQTTPDVKTFEMQKLASADMGSYAAVKAKFGALAVTDDERGQRATKDSRFALSGLLRDPLSIEDEERRVIEEKVQARVGALAEEAKAKAAEAGYQAGLKKGYQEAFTKFQQEGETRLESLSALLAELESAKEQIFRANERFVVELIYRIGRMVLLKELAIDKEYVLRLARDLIERVGVRENITIRIGQDDAATMGMIREGLEKSLGSLKNLEIQVSPQVKGGGCTIETEWNAIDASVEMQLQGLYDALVGRELGSGGQS